MIIAIFQYKFEEYALMMLGCESNNAGRADMTGRGKSQTRPKTIEPACLAYGGVLSIDLAALAHNYHLIANHVSPAQMSAVVKADAYGLGVRQVASKLYLAGCRLFFVAQMVEACHLRPHLPADAEIAILNDIQPGMEATAADHGFLPVLNSLQSIQDWGALCNERREQLPCFIQIDSGMSRLGLDHQELEALVARPDIFAQAQIRAIISHLACADEATNGQNTHQLKRFQEILTRLPPRPAALANSGGIFLSGHERAFIFDLVRPGLALYGVDPLGLTPTKLRPVVALSARVAQIRHVGAGSLVGYGGTYQAAKDMLVATISVGYADGMHRRLGGRGAAFYQNIRLPMIGRISMDSITLDISALPEGLLKRGSLVELIGPNQTITTLARDADTIAYEILTSLGRRFYRHYGESEERS